LPLTNISRNPRLAAGYSSRSQIARIVTETWIRDQMYCPACASEQLEPTRPGTKVVDFVCPDCQEPFQLKSQSRPLGVRVSDAAYEPMIACVKSSKAPTFLFLQYHPSRWRVQNLVIVGRHFLTPLAIEKRPALRRGARREGWVGCNILLSAVPPDARIHVVRAEVPTPPEAVRSSWRKFEFLRAADSESRGWMADVLTCIRELRRDSFSLEDVYSFESRLKKLHSRNRYVRPKIRQQLQVLRDHGVIEFVGRGEYRILLMPQQE
jgi:type II restriction enzyme